MKHTMDLLNTRRSLSDCGGNSLNASKTNVTHGKDPRDIGLKELRLTSIKPPLRFEMLTTEIRPCSYEPCLRTFHCQ
jgi:hypothetical protein